MGTAAPAVHPKAREVRLLAATAVVGVAVRIGLAVLADRARLPNDDQFFYHHMADGLAQGAGYQVFDLPTLRWPPAYPFLLSLVYRVTGTDVSAALGLNVLLSSLVVVATHWCVRPLIGPRAALAAAVIVALLPGQWLFAGTVLTEPLSTLQILLVLGLSLRLEPSARAAGLLGLLVGVAALTRGEGALLGLVVVAAWWPKWPWRRVLPKIALTAAVAAAVVAPWIARNSALAGELTGPSLNFAETLYSGHNPLADGGPTYAPPEVLAPVVADTPYGAAKELANAALLQRLAITWAREHPSEELALIPKRLLHLAEGDANVISVWIEQRPPPVLGRARAPLEVLADVSWYAFLAAFTITLVIRRAVLRVPWVRVALLLPALSLVLYGVILYGNFRYRIPYEPILALVLCAAWLPAAANDLSPGPRG